MIYYQYNTNPYQPLRADTEGNGSQARNKYKQILKMINFNQLQLREQDQVQHHIHSFILFSWMLLVRL